MEENRSILLDLHEAKCAVIEHDDLHLEAKLREAEKIAHQHSARERRLRADLP
jgi:hypothetical protein